MRHPVGRGITSGRRGFDIGRFPWQFVLPLAVVLIALTVLAPVGRPASAIPLPSAVDEFQPNLSTKFGGRSVAVDISPSDPNRVITAAESGGLFQSTDGGSNWSHVDSFVPHRMNDVKYAPNNASLLVATTWRNGDSANPGGIWRSTDGGVSWERPASLASICGGNFNAYGIAFEPSTTNVYSGTDCGLAASFDAGATWSLQASERVHAVVAHPNATIDLCTNNGHRRFTRTGTTLTPVGGPGADPIPGAGGGGCDSRNGLASAHDLAADPGDPQVLFVVKSGSSTTLCGGTVANPAGLDFLYESDDGGVNWTQIDSMCNPVRNPWVVSHRSRNGNPSDFDIYYSQGFNVTRLTCTTNVGGGAPRCTGPGAAVTAAHPDPSMVAFTWDSSNCAKFLVNDGGIEESADCGATFSFQAGSGSSNGNYNALQVYTVNGQVHPPAGHTDLFFGAQDNRNWGSPDGGVTWPNQDCCEGGHFDLPHSAASDVGQRVVYFTCGPPCPYRMAGPHLTGAANWPNPPGTDPGADKGSPVLIKGTTDTYVQWTQVAPPTNQLNRTTNAGGAWTAINGATIAQPLMSIPAVSGPPGDPTIYQAFCTVNCGFVAPAGGLMKITGAMGPTATVTNITAGLGTLGTYNDGQGAFLLQEPAFGVDPNNPLHLIAADVAGNMMRQSQDGGATWTADPALTNLVTDNGRLAFGNIFFVGSQARAIAFSPADSDIILVGTESAGIIASFDNGQSWAKLIGSEKVTAVTSFFFDEVHSDVFVSSYGRGLWKISLPSADLTISKSHHPDPATAGTELYYDITVTNDGPDAATNVIVTDELPPEVTFVTDTLPPPLGCTAVGQTVTCNLGGMASGATISFTIKVAVNDDAVSNAGAPLSIVNTATVASAGALDTDPSDNTAVDTVIVEDLADLAVTKICKPDGPLPAGETATCTVFVDNLGPSDARDVQLTDTILSDGSFTIGTVTASQGSCDPPSGGVVTCDLGDLAAASPSVSGRATVTIDITADEAVDINDLATAVSATPDPDTSNNQAQGSVSVTAVANLQLCKADSPSASLCTTTASASAGPDPVIAGNSLRYELEVVNTGPSTASNVVVEDILPSSVTIDSVSAAGGSCNAGTPGDPFLPTTCAFDSLLAGQSSTMTIQVTVAPDAVSDVVTDEATIHNDARVTSDTFDDDNSNNLATEDTTVQARADLAVSKLEIGTPIAGTDITYRYEVSNLGPSVSRDVSLRDLLPDGLTFLNAQMDTEGGSGGVNFPCDVAVGSNELTCPIGDLYPTDSVPVIVTMNFHIDPSVPDGTVLTNTADISLTDTPDPVAGNNSASDPLAVLARADVMVTKTSDADIYKPSKLITYTITVFNNGPSDAQGVVVTDDVPLDTKKDRIGVFPMAGCTLVDTLVTCNLGTIAVGESKSFQIFMLAKGNRGIITNTADVTSTTVDPDPANNSSTRVVLMGHLPKA